MLCNLSDSALIHKLKEKVQLERELLVDLLLHLEEVERRKLYLARGFPSLFAFCTEELGYSEGEAHSRIQAMRLGRVIPEVKEKIAQGELSLTVAAKVQGCFARAARTDRSVPREQKFKILEELSHLSTRKAETVLVRHFAESGVPREVTKPVSESLTRVEFNLNAGQMAKLEELKGLLAHKNYEGRLDKLFECMADMALAMLKKSKPDAFLLETPQVRMRQAEHDHIKPTTGRSRYIPVSARRVVWKRDQGRCQYQDPVTGRICGSNHALELDHIQPFANGGANLPLNLRLLCSAHNKWRAIDPKV